MPDAQPTTPPAAPVLPEKAQIAVSRLITIGVNALTTWLVLKGWASDDAAQVGLLVSAAALFVVGNGATVVWSYIRRRWLEKMPAPTQVVPPAAPPAPPKITIDVAKLTELIEPMVAKALDDTLKRRLDPLFPPGPPQE